MSVARRFGLSILSGAMLGFSFPPFPGGLLACVALVPLLIVLAEVDRVRSALKYVYVSMAVFHIITLNWTGGYVHMRDPYMMIAGGLTMLLHPFFYFLPLSAYLWTKRRWSEATALAFLPLYWVGYEYSHSLSEWSFPWLTLGNTQSYNLARIQFISTTGVWGLSLWILVLNVLTYVLIKRLLSRQWILRSPRAAALLGTILFIAILPTIHGTIVLSDAPPVRQGGLRPGEPTVTVGMVQANIDPWEKWRRNTFETVELYLERTQQLAGEASPRPDLVFWPETAVPYPLLAPSGRGMLDYVLTRLGRMEMPVLTGFQHAEFYTDTTKAPAWARRSRLTGERYVVYNAAAFLQPGSRETSWYGKMKMVPLAERVPYAEAFTFLDVLRWDVGVGGWQIGPGPVVFRDGRTGTRFCSVICYESVYPGYVAEFVRRGAEFIGIITIDSWWGTMSGAFQHHQFAIFRAVENRRWIARCAAGGISSYIDPYGRVYDATELFTERNLSRTIGRASVLTPYTTLGDWLGAACLIGGLVAVAGTFLSGRTKMGRAEREHH